ncbi:WXG100 family type VII secretion target [Streptomyces sp. LS1784]|uniref:WXG100 family type VII secretion target n=1 Tax=Streptomyces sp. LS1784 TaxID=2851533 RepID=UPI001CCEE672|nr:hypothetical protein [Streptomyces sp. LS1784]
MLSYAIVRNATFEPLHAAAEEWKTLQARYTGLKDRLTNEVANKLAAGWEGEAATQARAQIQKAAEQIDAAGKESADISGLLADAAQQFAAAQTRLKKIADEDGPANHLQVDGTGKVTDVHPLLKDKSAQADPDYERVFLPQRKRAVEDLVHSLEAALQQAADADQAAAWALRSDPNGANDYSFNANGYHNLKDAAEARKDLSDALALAGKGGGNLSVEEVTKLNALLEKRKNDPAFAEQFATTLGPRGTLEFWRDANDPAKFGAYSKERNEAVKKLQASLGATLGTATQSHSKPMQDWENEMLKLGPQVINHPGGGPQPRGYQLMSSLMRSGEYDTDFLNSYGDSLLKFERATKTDPQLIWAPDSTQPSWDHLGDGRGGDAMVGFMESLSHNPQASTRFLDPGDPRTNDHLTYLLDERRWPEEMGRDGKHVQGQHSLGLAIEAAATGDRAGQEDSVRHHSEAQARVMRDTVNMLDGGIGNEKLPAGMQRPIANALADYASDTHDILSGTNRAAKDHAGEDASGVWVDPVTGETRMATDKGSLIRVLRGLADDPESHHVVQQAEMVHVAQQLAELPPNVGEKEWKGVMANSSVALGVYDAVQADAILDQRDDDTKVEAWRAKGMYQGIGTPLKLVPIPGVADVAQSLLGSGIMGWQMSATEEINAAAAGKIEANTLTGANGRSGHEGISAMVEKWQQQRAGLNPDSPAVDWDEQQMRTIYNTGRSDAATALGRGGENK